MYFDKESISGKKIFLARWWWWMGSGRMAVREKGVGGKLILTQNPHLKKHGAGELCGRG